jgi:hypothetical protein
MIYYKELNAKIEGGINLRVVFRKAAENSFDRNTVTLIEKISVLTKTNEKILVNFFNNNLKYLKKL